MDKRIEDLVREAHRLYDIHDVLGVTRRMSWMVCPFPDHRHHSNTPSLSIYWASDNVQRFKCHGNCGKQGDVIDLAGYLHIPGYNPKEPEHVRQAGALLGMKAEIEPPVRPKKDTRLAPNAYRQYLPFGPEVAEYAARRGLTTGTLEKFSIGQYKHFMAIPTFEEGRLRGIKFRNTWPKERLDDGSLEGLRFWAARGSVKALFNYDAIAYTDKPLLVVKGEIPAMLCDQYGILACAPTGGEGSYGEQWAPLLAFSSKVVVVGDNDPDPEVREKMQAKARERAALLNAELRFPPEPNKDIDQWLLADPSAVEAIRSWLR